jgi:hypothetical protein
VPLRDAAAVNATRYAIGDALKTLGLPVSLWSGGRTKMNRTAQGYRKDHWVDAACVGEAGAQVEIGRAFRAVTVKAIGRGSHQVRHSDAHGFARGRAKRVKEVQGFRSGDLVRLVQPCGKHRGVYVGVVAVRERGDFDVHTAGGKVTAPSSRFTLLQRADGYEWLVA